MSGHESWYDHKGAEEYDKYQQEVISMSFSHAEIVNEGPLLEKLRNELDAQYEELRNNYEVILADVRERIKRLESENVSMKECLEWYANEDHYTFCSCGEYLASIDGPCHNCHGEQEAILDDHGIRANECLKKINNEGV